MKNDQTELMSAGALVRQPEEPLAVVPSNPMELMTMAISKGADVGTIERLAALYEKFEARRAKREFDEALAAFQSECPAIEKTTAAVGRDGRPMYHYASMEKILGDTKELRQKHGFSHTFDAKVDQGWVECFCILKHNGGHSERASFKVPATSKSPMMNDPQMYASALTFLQRYTLCAAFGIGTAIQDLDGRTEKPKPKGPSTLAADDTSLEGLRRELWELLKPVRGPERNWNAANLWLVGQDIIQDTENAPDFTAARFREVIAKAKAKLQQP